MEENTMKRLYSLLLAFAMLISMLPETAFLAEATSYSGNCGDALTWELDYESGILTISGSGAMSNYIDETAPWREYHNSIRQIIFDGDITSVGARAFKNYSEISTYGDLSGFAYTQLQEITIPGSIATIEPEAFYGCTSLHDVTLSEGTKLVGLSAFSMCSSLSNIYVLDDACDISLAGLRAATVVHAHWGSAAYLYAIENDYQVETIVDCDQGFHDYEKSVLKEPTCTEEGELSLTCKECGYTCTQSVPVSHAFTAEKLIGYNSYTCSICGFTYTENTAKEIQIDSIALAIIPTAGDRAYFSFTPEESGAFCFYSSGNNDTYCHLYDSSGNELETNDDGGNGANFSLSYTMTEGEQYIFCARYLSSTKTGFFAVTLEKAHVHDYVATEVVEPTCTEDGRTTYTCSTCGNTYTEYTDATGHNYEETILEEPSCTENGSASYTCAVCGDTYTDTLYAYGHHYNEEIIQAPTCTEGGLASYTCAYCGDTYNEELPPNGHSYEVTTITPATCTEDGEGVYTCSVCGDSYTGVIPGGHQYEIERDRWLITYTCSVCQETHTEDSSVEIVLNEETEARIESEGVYAYFRFVPTATMEYQFYSEAENDTYGYLYDSAGNELARNDDYNGYNFSISYTLTAGETYYYGARFYSSYNTGSFPVYLVFANHSHEFTSVVTVEPTCTEDGEQVKTCSGCGYSVTEAIAALGHDYEETIIQAATCETDGERSLHCTRCGETHTEVIPAGHSYEAVTDKWMVTYTCSLCGNTYTENTAEVISVGDTLPAEILNGGDYAYYSFTPTQTDKYSFCSNGNYDTYGYLYLDDATELAKNDDSGENSNFRISYTLEAGTTYIFAAKMYNSGTTGSFTVSLQTEHQYTSEVVVEPTCTQEGEIRYTCEFCGDTYTEVAPAGHKYENGVCIYCGQEEIASGTCGNNLTWTLNCATGELVINGIGTMNDYGYYNGGPWYDYRDRITSVSLPDGLTSIGSHAFLGCHALSTIGIPNTVTRIDEGAFRNCTGLTEFTVPDNVTILSDSTFQDCAALERVVLPNGLKQIDQYAFYGCHLLSDIEIPNTVEQIGYVAFENCRSITAITIPDSVTEIGGSAFNGCSSLEKVIIPNSVVSVGQRVFSGCTQLKTAGPIGGDYNIEYNWAIIPDNAFNDCRSLVSIQLPNTVTSIGSAALSSTGLTSLTIPDSVSHIGTQAFASCESLPKIYVSGNNDYYMADGQGVLYNKDQSELICCPSGFSGSYTIHNGTETIAAYAFYDCRHVTEVHLPSTINSIKDHAFYSCGITSISLPNSITRIEQAAFYISNLQSIVIPDSVTFISEHAFMFCDLTHVVIPANVTKIGNMAFYGCPLESVTILNPTCEITDSEYTFSDTDGSFRGVVYGYANSTAQSYAENYDFSFVALETDPCADGHTPGTPVIENYIAPSCTDAGSYDSVIYCAICGTDLSREELIVEALGHDWSDWTITAPGSCISTGEETRVCQRCAISETREIVSPPHTPAEPVEENRVEPTCTSSGSYDLVVYCSVCGAEISRDAQVLDALGHYYTDYNTVLSVGNTRVSCMQMLWHMAGSPEPSNLEEVAATYTDLDELTEEQVKAIAWAVGNNITVGTTSTNFSPNKIVNRAQFAVYLWTANGRPEPTLTSAPFTDLKAGSYYYKAVLWAASIPWIDLGSPTPTTFAPNSTLFGLTFSEFACDRCGQTQVLRFDTPDPTDPCPEGHNYISRVIAPTCTRDGGTKYVCTHCGDNYYEDVIPALGHDWSAWETVKLPTCVVPGEETRHCNRCDIVETRELALAPHTPGEAEDENTVAPTCTEDGSYDAVVYCIVCHEELSRATYNIGALGHDFGDWILTTEPTCTEEGVETRTCSRCEEAETRPVDALGHDYIAVVTAPTCTEQGYTTHTCSRCGDEYVDTYVDALGHDFGEWILTTEPTCTEEGVETRTCSRCEEAETRPVDALGHDYVAVVTAPTCTEQGYTTHTCSRCGDEYVDEAVEALGHNYISEITQEATCEEPGTKTYTCSRCGDQYTEDIPALGHDWVVSSQVSATCVSKGRVTYRCNNCGTSKNEILPIDPNNHTGNTYVSGVKEPTCTEEGYTGDTICTDCGAVLDHGETIGLIPHSYEATVVPPTYLEQGYTNYQCSVCGYSYQDDFVEALERTPLAEATLTLEYNSAYYKGQALTPAVTLEYGGEILDADTELQVTYQDNDHVGTATVSVEGINRFVGTVELTFDITYETIPETIRNVAAIGEIGKISISWSMSSEVNTTTYRIYRRAENEEAFTLLKTIGNRATLSYSDASAERDVLYYYYVTGVGLYGAESEPSNIASAKAAVDVEAPVITKLLPATGTRIHGTAKLTCIVSDNVGTTSVLYEASTDNETWLALGQSTSAAFALEFDTTQFADGILYVRAIAYDAEQNASVPYNRVYTVDNTAPEKVTGLRIVECLSSKLTLGWNDSDADDRAAFVVQMLIGDEFKTIATVSTIGYNVSGLQPNTEYQFRVACRDTCGNQSEWSDFLTVTTSVDLTPPVVTSLSPTPAAVNQNIPFQATAKDECGVAEIAIQASTDLSTWITLYVKTYDQPSVSCTCSYTVDISPYEEGYLYLRAIAKDGSGNTSTEDETAPLNGYYIDRTAPEAPTGVTAEGKNGYITVSWTQGTESGLKYFVYRASEENGSFTQIASNLAVINFHDRNVETQKTYWYKIAVVDSCGNRSAYSDPVSAQTSTDAEKPVIQSFSQTYNNSVSASYPVVKVLATDNSRLESVTVSYQVNGAGEYHELLTVNQIHDYSKLVSVTVPVAMFAHGDLITLKAVATDTAGLVSDALTAVYTVDVEGPQIENLQAALEDRTCTITWNGCGEADLSGYIVYRATDAGAFTKLGSRTANAEGQYTFIDTITANASHTYTYKVVAVDKLGNNNTYTQDVIYTYVRVNAAPTAVMNIPAYMEVNVEQYFDAAASTDDGTIVSYHWSFGDNTSSNDAKTVKRYSEAGTYTVTLTVTDEEGLETSAVKTVTVKERSELGILNVKVVDDNYNVLPNAKVIVDKGAETECVVSTNGTGIATVQLPTGNHVVAAYLDASHLPAKKTAAVLANASRTVTLILVEEELVTGEFDISRMDLDDIIAAGIDIYDPANQNIYQVEVRVTYGGTPYTISYQRNDTQVLSYEMRDAYGNPVNTVTNSNGEPRVLTPTIIPSQNGDGGADIIALLDIPAQVSYLKEFFDVKLYITNHAAEEFVLTNNNVALNVPEGMTLMSGLAGYSDAAEVQIAAIAGQETALVKWCLRGDEEGDYGISADYVGYLDYFDEIVTTTFNASKPIKVYGLNGIEMSVLSCDEIHNGAFYFKIGLANKRDIDLYMPNISLFDLVENVTESVAYQHEDGDFVVQSYVLNTYIELENGARQYLPVKYDANGDLISQVKVLAPGQRLVCEYVSYNAVKEDDVGYFKEAMTDVLSGYAQNVVVGSYDRAEFSMEDFTAKLDRILSRNDAEINSAYDYIMSDGNYYYVSASRDPAKNIFVDLYKAMNLFLDFDLECMTMEEERELAQKIILDILLNQETIDAIDDQVALEFLDATTNAMTKVKTAFMSGYDITSADYDTLMAIGKSDLTSLTKTLATKGTKACEEELYTLIANRAVGYALASDAEGFYQSLGIEDVFTFNEIVGSGNKLSGKVLKGIRLIDSTLERSYIYSTLYANASNEYSNFVLDGIIDYCRETTGDRAAFEKYFLQETIPQSDTIASQSDRLALAIAVVAAEDKIAIRDDAAARTEVELLLLSHFAGEVAKDVVVPIVKKAIGDALGAPYAIAGKVWNKIDKYFNLGAYVKQQDSMVVYDFMGSALASQFRKYIAGDDRTEKNDLYALSILKSVCLMRLEGERQYRGSVTMYVDRKEGYSISKEEAIALVNEELGTSYTSLEEWYSEIRYNILSARDILFNKEITDAGTIPDAPEVTLDYELNQTEQVFSPAYEYCFADGVWHPCDGAPIQFVPKSTQTVLRVRVAASETNLAGQITTVFIFAQKQLSKLITVQRDDSVYTVNHLAAGREYQMVFVSSEEESYSWEAAVSFTADADGVGTVSSLRRDDWVVIRSVISPDDNETYSVPLLRPVATRQPLSIRITGCGTIAQSRADGCYFLGEDVSLTAVPNPGYVFEGWYIDGALVSAQTEYLLEMGTASTIEARFAGIPADHLSIDSMPEKLAYTDGDALDLSGLVISVVYEDGSSITTENYSAELKVGTGGNAAILIRVGLLQAEIPVAFTHEAGDWEVLTAVTCTTDGYRIRRCAVCGAILEEEVIPAPGHQYQDGVCVVCGEEEIPFDQNLKIKTASITLQSDLSINYYVADSVLDGWGDPYIELRKAQYDTDGNVTGYETKIVSEFVLANAASDGTPCHVFKFSGISAFEMGSNITATIYAVRSNDGRLCKGKTVNYSVLTYATNQLRKTKNAKLRTLLVDLLNYGSAAQIYWNYNTANLANANLTEEQQSYATTENPQLTNYREMIKNDGATVSFKTCSLSLKEKVMINYYLNLSAYIGEVNDLELHVSFIDTDGKQKTEIIGSSEFEYKPHTDGNYYYVANFSSLNAIQMRTLCTAEVFSKTSGLRISNTVVYSIESYAQSKSIGTNESLANLVIAMMKYGDSTENFFLK